MSHSTPPAAAYQEYLESELASENERSIHGIFTQVTRYGLLKFGAVLFSCPFETVKILRQVQCGSSLDEPHGSDEAKLSREEEGGGGGGGEGDEGEDTLLPPSFVADSERRARAVGMLYANHGQYDRMPLPADISRDPSGYLVRRLPAGPISRWPLVLDKRRSLWHSIGHIGRHQGLLSLWRGTSAAWCQDVLMELGRASIEEALDSCEFIQRLSLPSFGLDDDAAIMEEDIVKPALIAGLAQGIVGTLLSPLEMVRLRMAVQSVWREEQKYHGLFHTMATIVREEEGGLLALYRHPLLTFTSHLVRPILHVLPVSLISSFWAPRDDAPLSVSLLWLAVQNLAMCFPLLVTLPLETVRRRLLVQTHPRYSHLPAFVTRVRLGRYEGAINCAWRVLREEGVGALYQGWAMQVAATTASFAMTMLAEMGEEDLGADGDLEL